MRTWLEPVPWPIPLAAWRVLCNQLKKKEKARAWFMDGRRGTWAQAEDGQWLHDKVLRERENIPFG